MLKSLDPILITIIVMSAVGVLLGAVCGVLFYCVCAHTSNRNLSALENYNFELVDGVKLKKEKLSAQKSYTEAWGMLDEPRKHLLDNVGGPFLERSVSQGRDWVLFSGRAGRETGRETPCIDCTARRWLSTVCLCVCTLVAGDETKTKLFILLHSWIFFFDKPLFQSCTQLGFQCYCARLCLEMCLFSW